MGFAPLIHPPSACISPIKEFSLTVIDPEAGGAREVLVSVLAAGDRLFRLVETGGRLVFQGAKCGEPGTACDQHGAYSLAPGLEEPASFLGGSSFFVPSATDGRLWLAIWDPYAPRADTHPELKAVREVTVDGEVMMEGAARPPGFNLVAALKRGLVFQDDDLQLWDPETGDVVMRFGGVFPVASRGNVLAWCDYGCAEIHLTDVGSSHETIALPGVGFAFEETYDGRFSPDGSLIAVPWSGMIRPTGSLSWT